MPTWTKLEKWNNWGVDYWRLPPTPTRSGGGHWTHGAVSFRDTVTVRWPDGTVRGEVVASRRVSNEVSDHGHSYRASGDLPVIAVEIRGVPAFVELDQVEVDVDSLADPGWNPGYLRDMQQADAHTPPAVSR